MTSADFSCPRCRQPYWLTGDTLAARVEALAWWRCQCTPEPPREDGAADKRRGSRPRVGHYLRAVALYVGVPVVAWAFLVALIWPHL